MIPPKTTPIATALAALVVATSAAAQVVRPGDSPPPAALVRPTFAAPPAPLTGAQVYENVCQACHMANAMGATGAGRIASLAKNPNLKYPEYPIAVVTGGKGAMPWFRGQLTDEQIADVITYVRTHFGNSYKARVTVAQVAESGVPAPHEYER